MFWAIISPILRSTRPSYKAPAMLPAGSITGALYHSCKHSLLLLRMGEIIARNMLNLLKLLIKLLLLHLVGCLCYCINDARSQKHQIRVFYIFRKKKKKSRFTNM